MKKLLVSILTLVLAIGLLGGCAPKAEPPAPADTATSESAVTQDEATDETGQDTQPLTIRLGGLKGPTSMGMVKMLNDAEEGKTFNKYDFTLSGSPDEVVPKLVNGDLDVAAVPSNLAAVLYNTTEGKIKMLAATNLGILYIVEKGDTIKNFSDLKGKTIYASGRGATPEYMLNYLLKENGVDPEKDVTIEWKSEHSEVVALMAEGKAEIALLPQPFVTVAQGTIEDLRVAIDLTKEWDAIEGNGMLIMTALVVNSDFADAHPEQIEKFLEEYKASTEYVNSNITEASKLIEKFDIVKADVAEKALPYCNIVFYDGAEMKTAMEGYLKILYDQNPKSVGGTLPDENFYYKAQ